MFISSVLSVLASVVLPPACVFCGETPGPPLDTGRRPPGLRPWDGPSLCPGCRRKLGVEPCRRLPAGGDGTLPPAYGGMATGGDLVTAVGAMKYHGVRGVALELAPLMIAAAAAAVRDSGEVDLLVPMPLHRTRLRSRGFNQAGLLSYPAAEFLGARVENRILRRSRATAQQAKLASSTAARSGNVAAAFTAAAPPAAAPTLGLVDDIVTTGSTVAAAARALSVAGWRVKWAIAAGVSPAPGQSAGLDTAATRS